MGFTVKIEGASESIDLGLTSLTKVEFETETPNDSNARSTDLGVALRITGKIITTLDGDDADSTLKIANWSLVSSESADCYRNVTVDVISADQVVREIKLPNAFVVDYEEKYGDTEGIGTFELVVRQKKDKNASVEYQGGFAL